jgi:alcohol dehydrogenase
MKAIAVTQQHTLEDTTLPVPQAAGRDLLVEIEAISVNPVDYKQRKAALEAGQVRVLGYDAVGTVVEAGPAAQLFKKGDRVFYAGDITRQGSNAEFQLVDERIAGRAPASIPAAQAAALPLTAITAWEAMFDRLAIVRGQQHGAILIIGGAGGVGSIAIQLARQLTGLTVIATASRPESARWVRELGAHHVVNHAGDMPAELAALGIPAVDYVLVLNELDGHFPAIAAAVAPQGKVVSIVRNERPLPVDLLFAKSVSFGFELMFTRSMFTTADIEKQHQLLNEVAAMVDSGAVRTTLGEHYGKINAANLARAHAALEAGRMIGKIVLEGF